ncbi:hypothetical protein OPT61_g5747 [Boeremia exigua]|uniref:Uncharacterized protein n=1 Tax=Boeremia exigua TaxID=749465 RepID=A0ACC2I9B8_9PLEO|nr:hypothetical protein OPT61_g5747 [Boeremia exigua]
MQAQTARFFCGCLGKRPSTPKPLPEENDLINSTKDLEIKLEGHVIPPNAAEALSLARNTASRSSSIKLSEAGPLSVAFNRACLNLHKDQRTALEKAQGLQELFEQLDTLNSKSRNESPFRRGVQKLGPVLAVLGGSTRLATPLAALDPVANNAFGIIQSVMTIAIGICGAEGKFHEDIQEMLRRVSITERCDDIWDSTRSQESPLLPVLVCIYTNLLDFYFEAMDIFKDGCFFINMQKSRFKQRLPEIVSSFTDNADQLDTLLNIETLALIQEIGDEQSSTKLRMLLNSGSQDKEVEYYNSLQQRADEACTWIVSTVGFREWLKDSNDLSSKFCILFGNMGSGKSVTTGFVVDFLVSHPALSGSLKPFVCVYYCKNDNETNKARNIYCSILWQILVRMVHLESRFMKWYKEAQTKNSLVDPTLDDNALRDFLVSVLRRFSRRLYLVLDGVDECDYDNRDHVLNFFEKLSEHRAPVNVFLSCRYDESIKDRLPPGRRILQMNTSLDRDYVIAAFQVNHVLNRQPEEVKKLIIKELAKQAEGSALWLKMVLEYLRRPHRSENEIKRVLQRVPSPQSLSTLYRNLLEAAIADNSDVAKTEYALETLAVSGRLLSLNELACAVTLQIEEKNISSLSDMEQYMVDSKGLLELISPFVRIMDITGGATISIVHQSLKDLIVRERPLDWGSQSSDTSANMEQRQSILHSNLLKRCIKYLLLSDLEDKDLFPKEKLEAMEEQAYDLEFLGRFAISVDEAQPDEPRSPSPPHLHHRVNSRNRSGEPSGRNVLHCAASSRNPEIVRLLAEKFPSGVNEQTESGDTPLHILVYACPTNVEAIRVLIEIGLADVNLSPGEEWYSPLRTAIRAKNVEVCQLLAAHGARVDEAIEFDQISGYPILKDSLEDSEASRRILKVLALASQSEACEST